MTTAARRSAWAVALAVALLTAVAEVAMEPWVAQLSDEPFTPGYIFVAGGLVGLTLVTLTPRILRLVGAGLLVGTTVAFLVIVVLVVDELNALGTTGV